VSNKDLLERNKETVQAFYDLMFNQCMPRSFRRPRSTTTPCSRDLDVTAAIDRERTYLRT